MCFGFSRRQKHICSVELDYSLWVWQATSNVFCRKTERCDGFDWILFQENPQIHMWPIFRISCTSFPADRGQWDRGDTAEKRFTFCFVCVCICAQPPSLSFVHGPWLWICFFFHFFSLLRNPCHSPYIVDVTWMPSSYARSIYVQTAYRHSTVFRIVTTTIHSIS